MIYKYKSTWKKREGKKLNEIQVTSSLWPKESSVSLRSKPVESSLFFQVSYVFVGYIYQCSFNFVTCVRCRGNHPLLSGENVNGLSRKCEEKKEFLSLISEKFKWELSPSILVTRNPNWSQRSGTETGCVNGRY
jgi:hypothetical protein